MSSQKEKKSIPIELKVWVQPAKRDHFIFGRSVQYGRIYFIKRPSDGEFEGPYLLRPEHVEDGTFKQYLEDETIYVIGDADREDSRGVE